jgi:hypothetical protein
LLSTLLPWRVALLLTRYSPPPWPRVTAPATLPCKVLWLSLTGLWYRYTPRPSPFAVALAMLPRTALPLSVAALQFTPLPWPQPLVLAVLLCTVLSRSVEAPP